MSTRWRPSWASSACDLSRQLLEEVHGRSVDEGVHGVEAQAVEVVVAQPHQGVVAEEAAHLLAARAVEIHGRAPGRLVAVGEVRAEAPR